MIKFFLAGAAISVGATFPLAALMALVFRFPIPFGSYMSGIGAVIPALFAAAFYGMIGGFMVQALLGGLTGGLARPPQSPIDGAPGAAAQPLPRLPRFRAY